jgi:DNA-binding MarR family transcriptional regulator
MIDDVLIAIRRIIRAMDLHSKHLVKTTGLTTAQLLLMQKVQNGDSATIGNLADQIHLSQATVTTILDRLAQRGLIVREVSLQDKRKVHIKLTEEGELLVTNSPVPLQQHFVKNYQNLNKWEQTTMLSILQRVSTMMDVEDIQASPKLEIGDHVREGHGQTNNPVLSETA